MEGKMGMSPFDKQIRKMENKSGYMKAHMQELASNKDLSYALFMGERLDLKFSNPKIAERNRKIVEFFSLPIAQVNKAFFSQQIKSKLIPLQQKSIKEIDDDGNPFVDSYGRCSFFFVEIGGEKIPIYQPGTIMFESGIKEGTDISIYQNGVLQNGPCLGLTGALFIAKFLARIVNKYETYCEQDNKNPKILDRKLFKRALKSALLASAAEDMKEHGRLIALKQQLNRLIDSTDKLEIKDLAMFQLKDFVRQDTQKMYEFEENLETIVINSQEALDAIDNRQKHMVFYRAKLLQVGAENIDDWIEIIRDDILAKDGIVVPEAEDDFRHFVSQCMNRTALDRLSSEFNSFQSRSFRLDQLNKSVDLP